MGLANDMKAKITHYRFAAYFCAAYMKPLRILFLTNRVPYPLHDGGALAMDALICGYKNAGLQVRLLAMNTSRHRVDEPTLATLYEQLDGFDVVNVNNDVKPFRVLTNLLFSNKPEHVSRFYFPAFTEKLQEILVTFKPDVVQIESPFLTTYLPLITKAKTVMRVHNAEFQIWERLAKGQGGIKGWYLKTLAKRMRNYEAAIWGKYDLLLAITPVDAALIKKILPQQEVIVAPYALIVPNNLQIPKTYLDSYHIGAMDWLPNAEGIDWMIKDVWPKIIAVQPDAQFFFGGRNMPLRNYTHLPHGVHCNGEVEDVGLFIADKQILLVPLLAGGGIRIKILEAMAAGKLVISTGVGMQGIDAQSGVQYLEANTPEEFGAAFQLANTQPEKTQEMIQQARELILKEYSIEGITNKILVAIKKLAPRT